MASRVRKIYDLEIFEKIKIALEEKGEKIDYFISLWKNSHFFIITKKTGEENLKIYFTIVDKKGGLELEDLWDWEIFQKIDKVIVKDSFNGVGRHIHIDVVVKKEKGSRAYANCLEVKESYW